MAGNLFDLSGKIAVVTGGTGAIGGAFVRGLADAGASVAILSRTEASTRELANAINAEGGRAIGIPADVLDKTTLRHALDRVMETYGQVDILINAAGGNRPEATAMPKQRTFFELSEDALQWVFDLNFMGSLLPSQVFGEQMKEQGEGVIVNVSSMASYRPMTRVVAYAGAKAAINNFTQWLAIYMAKEHSPNIRVNAVAPGFFLSEQNRFLLTDRSTGELTERGRLVIDHTPMGRFGDVEELVGTVLWLVSDASRFVTGIVVPVDGGFSAYSGV